MESFKQRAERIRQEAERQKALAAIAAKRDKVHKLVQGCNDPDEQYRRIRDSVEEDFTKIMIHGPDQV